MGARRLDAARADADRCGELEYGAHLGFGGRQQFGRLCDSIFRHSLPDGLAWPYRDRCSVLLRVRSADRIRLPDLVLEMVTRATDACIECRSGSLTTA